MSYADIELDEDTIPPECVRMADRIEGALRQDGVEPGAIMLMSGQAEFLVRLLRIAAEKVELLDLEF